MAQEPSFRYRTILEVAIISLIIYYFLGIPGLSSSSTSTSTSSPTSRIKEPEVPEAKAKAESLVYPDPDLKCPPHAFKNIHIFSTSPLVIYIDGFLSEAEADHLVAISATKWQPSTIFNRGVEQSNDKVRKSDKALIDRDTTVQCIEARALAFQGWPRKTHIERLWTQRYNVSGHYAHHYDWGAASSQARRTSTFMVYLSSGEDVEGGGTNFPRLERPAAAEGRGGGHGDWCEFIECDGEGGDEAPGGVTFKVRKGAAVFWMNFDAEGRGYKETIHAGMPVRKGVKVGLNIWSWFQA